MRPINNAASWLFVYARGWCHFIVFSWTLLTAYLWRVTERKHPGMQMQKMRKTVVGKVFLLELGDVAEKIFRFDLIYMHLLWNYLLIWCNRWLQILFRSKLEKSSQINMLFILFSSKWTHGRIIFQLFNNI